MLPSTSASRLTINGAHYYTVDGTVYPSVTTVVGVVNKPGLLDWVKRVTVDAMLNVSRDDIDAAREIGLAASERIRQAAARAGSELHELLATALINTSVNGNNARGEVLAARAFLSQHNLTVLATEYTVVSRVHGFAGTCDVVARRDDGTLAVVDWKSGSIYADYALQAGAYALAIEEMTSVPVTAAYIVSFKRAAAEAKRVNLLVASAAFLHALALWRAQAAGMFADKGL